MKKIFKLLVFIFFTLIFPFDLVKANGYACSAYSANTDSAASQCRNAGCVVNNSFCVYDDNKMGIESCYYQIYTSQQSYAWNNNYYQTFEGLYLFTSVYDYDSSKTEMDISISNQNWGSKPDVGTIVYLEPKKVGYSHLFEFNSLSSFVGPIGSGVEIEIDFEYDDFIKQLKLNKKCPSIYSEYEKYKGTTNDGKIRIKMGSINEVSMSDSTGDIVKNAMTIVDTISVQTEELPERSLERTVWMTKGSLGESNFDGTFTFNINKKSDNLELCVSTGDFGNANCSSSGNMHTQMVLNNNFRLNFSANKEEFASIFNKQNYGDSDIYIKYAKCEIEKAEHDYDDVYYLDFELSTIKNGNAVKTGNNVAELFKLDGLNVTCTIRNKKTVDNCNTVPQAILNCINDALKLLRWVALALMIILGVLDFTKAVASDDQDALKKAWQHFTKRLIAVIILFLLPLLIELILTIADLNNNCTNF